MATKTTEEMIGVDKAHDDSDGEITEAEKNQLKLLPEEPASVVLADQDYLDRAKELLSVNTGIDIHVDSSKEINGGAFSKNYVVYEVKGHDKNGQINVSRRYREFDALRNKLKQNWPGIFIPSIPEKKAVNNSDVTAHRMLFLDHFLKKCAKLDHIFYSEEMQLFLRATGGDDLVKTLDAIPARTCSAVLNQYKVLFPGFDADSCNKELEEKVDKKIQALKACLEEVKGMRKNLKIMREYRQSLKTMKADMAMLVAHHAFGKVKDKAVQEELNGKVKQYQDVEKKEDIKHLLWNLKILRRDLESFLLLPADIAAINKKIQQQTTLVNETSQQYHNIKVSDKDVVSDGLFKKVPKEAKLAELDKILDTAKEEQHAATLLHKLLYVLLDKREIPMIVYVKNNDLADGIMELSKQRTEALNREMETLDLFVKEIDETAANTPTNAI